MWPPKYQNCSKNLTGGIRRLQKFNIFDDRALNSPVQVAGGKAAKVLQNVCKRCNEDIQVLVYFSNSWCSEK